MARCMARRALVSGASESATDQVTAMDDPIDVSPSSSRATSPVLDRRAVLTPAIQSVVSALGGFDAGADSYLLGDSCLGCLKDLKKFWRKDDTDDERTVARIFWDTRVLPNDLVPILLVTAGKGHVQDRCAIACGELAFILPPQPAYMRLTRRFSLQRTS